jgi:hypothetical protein
MCTDWDITDVRDFEILNEMFNRIAGIDPLELIQMYQIKTKDFISVPVLNADTSAYVVNTFDEFYRLNRV